MTDDKHQMFTDRYDANETPWDTDIIPPEIVKVLEELPAGRALDLGCGTGTVIKTLLEHGWQADGVDFVQAAIDRAEAKLATFPAEQYNVFRHDVTALDMLAGLRPPYDLLIDIGCGHATDKAKNDKYARDLASLIREGGTFMLYSHQPHEDTDIGWAPADVHRLFTPAFKIVSEVANDDTSTGMPSVWYRFEKKAD